ncbi:MAG: PASTA domain-containing protein [Candidatus Hydrogenedentes bacterium]|nr:PASTA domain-containing protein [Candidatus Hydrogenedentota bacterium]
MRKAGVVFFLAATLLTLPAWATQLILDAAIAEYPFIDGTRLDSCSLCHTTVPTRNPYGTALENAGLNFDSIENLDSDGDGITNIDEITDLTFPGNASDFPTGAIQVTLEPQAAMDADAQWRIGPSGAFQNSGATVTGVKIGDVTVQFKPVTGWNTPADQVVTILFDQTVTATGTYTQQQVAVPNVVGMTQANAETAITNAGLTVGTVVQEASDTVPLGEVISQVPAAATMVAVGSAVDLTVSAGPSPVTVPNVVGMAQATAETAITTAGLTVGTVTEVSNPTVPLGEVISQTPAAGMLAAPGSAVNLRVSLGAVPITVPNVVGMTQAEAEAAITDVGLTVGTVTQASSDTVPVGSVISQNPTAGVEAASGAAVALTISTGPAITTGSLQVNIEPEAARDDGAQWRVDGGALHDSGAIATLTAGLHTVSFNDISCTASGCFGTGGKQLPWESSGDSSRFDAVAKTAFRILLNSLKADKQGGCFATCQEWLTPANQEVTIVAGQTLVVTGTYTPADKTASAQVLGGSGGDMIVLSLMALSLFAARRIKLRKHTSTQ